VVLDVSEYKNELNSSLKSMVYEHLPRYCMAKIQKTVQKLSDKHVVKLLLIEL
jgi:hypothetical protein